MLCHAFPGRLHNFCLFFISDPMLLHTCMLGAFSLSFVGQGSHVANGCCHVHSSVSFGIHGD